MGRELEDVPAAFLEYRLAWELEAGAFQGESESPDPHSRMECARISLDTRTWGKVQAHR